MVLGRDRIRLLRLGWRHGLRISGRSVSGDASAIPTGPLTRHGPLRGQRSQQWECTPTELAATAGEGHRVIMHSPYRSLCYFERDYYARERQSGRASWCYAFPVQREVLLAGQDATPAAPEDESPVASSGGPATGRSRRLSGRGDLVGVAWVVLAGLALLVPMIVHGRVLGPFDLLSRIGLTKHPGIKIHSLEYGDVIDSLLPWSTMVWRQVHQGFLPLWNPYGGLGMPLAFNWQSAPFSLPSLIGYLSPLRYAFTVGVAVDLVVAGTGAYVVGRVLGMGVVASATVGTVFELSGPIAAWLGYPFPSVLCWSGWIFAFGLLLVRGRHRAGYVVALAVCIALALYGGAPEGFAVLLMAAAVFFVYLLVSRAGWAGGSGPIRRPALDLVAAVVAGIALAAPFALPGLQLTGPSVRSLEPNGLALSSRSLLYLGFQAFDGLPLTHNGRVVVFGDSAFYTETAMYVGVSALVLGALGIVLSRRRRELQAFVVITVLCLAVVFVPPSSPRPTRHRCSARWTWCGH